MWDVNNGIRIIDPDRHSTFVGVGQRHFGTGFSLLGCEVQVERSVRSDIRRNMLSKDVDG